MSQPPEQPLLTTASSFTSNHSTTDTPTDNNFLASPSPRTLSNSLTPSLPAGVPSPLTYTPSIGAGSPAFSVGDSIYSPNPRASSFPSFAPPSSQLPPPHSQPSRALAESGHRHLSAVLAGLHALLSSYQQLSAVDGGDLQSAATRRDESDEHDRQLAATAQLQRQHIETSLASLHTTVAVLVERDTPKPHHSATDDEQQRIQLLTARRDHLLQLVSDGNADVLELVGRLRGLHRSLGLFAHEHDVEMRTAPILSAAAQPTNNNARR